MEKFELDATNAHIFFAMSILEEAKSYTGKAEFRFALSIARDRFQRFSDLVNSSDAKREVIVERILEIIEFLKHFRFVTGEDTLDFQVHARITRALYHASRIYDFHNPALIAWHTIHPNHVTAS